MACEDRESICFVFVFACLIKNMGYCGALVRALIWTHDRKAVGTSPDWSSLCLVPEQHFFTHIVPPHPGEKRTGYRQVIMFGR